MKKVEESKETGTFNFTQDDLIQMYNIISFRLSKNKQLSQKIQERDIFDIIERLLTLQKQLQPPKKEESADILEFAIEFLKFMNNPEILKMFGVNSLSELIDKIKGALTNK